LIDKALAASVLAASVREGFSFRGYKPNKGNRSFLTKTVKAEIKRATQMLRKAG
jgi:hypothetical protein